MKIVVTGASGRLGREVCRALAEAGHDVRGVDQFPGREKIVPVEVYNLLDREACYRVLDGAEAVAHFGNHPRPDRYQAHRVFNENTVINMNVFQAACDTGVKKIIFSSSIQAISGGSTLSEETPSQLPYLPLDGDVPPNPGNSYALSKVVGETILRYVCRQKDIEGTALRFPWLRSPRRHSSHFRYGLKDMPERYKHHVTRDEAFAILDIGDAADLIRRLAERPMPGFRVYLPAAREPWVPDMTVAELIEEIYPDVPLRRPAEEMDSLVDVSRLEADTGWRPSAAVKEQAGSGA